MKITYEQALVQRLKEAYPTNTLSFTISVLANVYTPEFLDREFFNDSPTMRNYGAYLVIENHYYKKLYSLPYCAGMSFPILTSMIDMMLSREIDTHDIDFSDDSTNEEQR